MRRIHFLFFFLLLLLGSGCTHRTQLTLAVWGGTEERTAWETVLQEFKAQHAVGVRLLFLKSPEEVEKQASRVDVMMIQNDQVAGLVQSQKIDPLLISSPTTFACREELQSLFKMREVDYAMPLGWSTHVVYCNRTLFERQGVPIPRDSWDWGDLLNVAQSLTCLEGDASQKQYGLALSSDVKLWAPLIWQNRGKFTNDRGDWVLTDPLLIQTHTQALEFYADLIRKYQVAKWTKSENPDGEFLKGKIAMLFSTRGLCQKLKNSPLKFSWDMVALPHSGNSATWLTACGLAISKTCRDQATAEKLVLFLVSETSQGALIQTGAWLPSHPSLLESKLVLNFGSPHPVRNSLFKESLRYGITAPPFETWPALSKILSDSMGELIQNPKMTGRMALDRMQNQILEWSLTTEDKKILPNSKSQDLRRGTSPLKLSEPKVTPRER